MRKILAITVALMIAAIVLMPALGYTNQAAENQSYSAKSGNQVEHSFKTLNAPAHNLTPDMMANKYSFKSDGVQSTRMPYSFQKGAATPNSFKMVNAGSQGMKPVLKLGSINKVKMAAPVVETIDAPMNETVDASMNETVDAPMNETVDASMNETVDASMNETVDASMNETVDASMNETVDASMNETVDASMNETVDASMNETVDASMNETVDASMNETVDASMNETVDASMNETVDASMNETVDAPKFTIEGMAVDINQTGLAGWTINLTVDGAVINSVPTAADGKFAFPDLAAGEYTVSEVLMQGWSIISPAEGKSVVTIANASVTDLVFVNQLG